jgi:hypothetical protein
MRKFFGIVKLILSVMFLLLTITTANYYSNFEERDETDSIPLLNKPSAYVVVAVLYLLYCICLGYSGMAEIKQREIKQKAFVWISVALGLTFVVNTYLVSTTTNIIFALIALLVSVRDLVLVNKKPAALDDIAGKQNKTDSKSSFK